MAISREFVNIDNVNDSKAVAQRFDDMINRVINMLNKEGPIYSTWIRFQIGKKQPLTFSTGSTDELQNLIADLSVDKQGNGVCNTFTLNVRYDPFNYGQNPSDKIELLDDLVATAMSFDISTEYKESDGLDNLRGYIQYGYNSTSDSKLVSPKYEFLLTNAESNTNMINGITTYTFTGTSDLAIDCDFSIAFPEVNEKNLLEVVTTVLYNYYGDSAHKPNHVLDDLGQFVENDYKYRIQIAEDLYNDAQTITYPTTSEMSPWQYCKNLFNLYISKSDSENDKYKDLTTMTTNQRPYYQLYLSDEADHKTIYVTYSSPLEDDANISLKYEFTWSNGNQSIVENWNPKADLQMYLIRKAMALREDRLASINADAAEDIHTFLNSTNMNFWASVFNTARDGKINLGDSKFSNVIEYLLNNSAFIRTAGEIGSNSIAKLRSLDVENITAFLDRLQENTTTVTEMYDAEMTLIGIPADIPITTEIRVKPVIESSVSRTAGIYRVTGCTDEISSDGVFKTTLKLFRMKGLN